VLEPHDFLRRLAALVSVPYAHQVRRHGVFANRSRFRRRLPAPPPSRFAEEMELPAAAAGAVTVARTGSMPETSCPRMGSTVRRQRAPWAQLLRRVLQVDALACPRCSTRDRTVPMTVLAFLSDPEVVGKILRHLGRPTVAPALAASRGPAPALGFVLPQDEAGPADVGHGGDTCPGEPATRPPP
jgi:hypothetical protein